MVEGCSVPAERGLTPTFEHLDELVLPDGLELAWEMPTVDLVTIWWAERRWRRWAWLPAPHTQAFKGIGVSHTFVWRNPFRRSARICGALTAIGGHGWAWQTRSLGFPELVVRDQWWTQEITFNIGDAAGREPLPMQLPPRWARV